MGSHSSWPVVARRLQQPTREQREPRYRSPIWPCSGWGLPCRPCYQVRGGLLPAARLRRPPRTSQCRAPFHPCLIPRLPGRLRRHESRRPSAVCSLLHFPSPRGARQLAGIPLYGARTFLCTKTPMQRLPGQLHELHFTVFTSPAQSTIRTATNGKAKTTFSGRPLRDRAPARTRARGGPMRRRLYFLLPDLPSATQVVEDLLLARVEARHIHVLARRGSSTGSTGAGCC